MSDSAENPTAPIEAEVARVNIPIGMFSSGPRVRLGTIDRVFMPHEIEKVIILGMGHSIFDWITESYGDAPIHAQDGVEVWSINYSGLTMYSHVCFNMHDLDADLEHRKIFESYNKMPQLKVVGIKAYDWLDNSYEFPLQEVMEDPYASVPYFTNSTSYLVALAIACRAKEIKLYGCDFDYDERYMDVNKFERGRANMEFWLGRASAYGCLLTVASHSTLLAASEIKHAGRIPFYGYGKHQPQFQLTDENKPIIVGFDTLSEEAEKALESGGPLG